MKVIKTVGLIIGLPVALFALFLIISTLNDYRPDSEEIVFTSADPDLLPMDEELSLVIWNIGYAGLDASMDFFYDGGTKVRPDRDGVDENLAGITTTLKAYGDYDFVLLQEVDRKSKRSYRVNEYAALEAVFPNHHSSFGMNYRVWFVPMPVMKPMGGVKSGLQTLSAGVPREVVRHSFPGNYAWPMSLFLLDRCFLAGYYPTADGKDLVVINTHNSAYDDGTLRKGQMVYLREFLLDEYARGNYVIVGGDWNQSPPDFVPGFNPDRFDRDNLTFLDSGYPESSWQWVYDARVPTNRRVKTAYDPETSPVTLIDLFLLSPNLRALEVKGHEVGFRYSDHQPVTLRIVLD